MNMNREEFLHKLSGGLAATCVACMAAACSKEESVTPAPRQEMPSLVF